MSHQEGDDLTVTVDGDTREVTVETETADGLLLVTDGEERFTVGKGEVQETRELAFEVYRDDANSIHGQPDFFAVMTGPGPDTPRGTLEAIQDAVDARVEEGDDFGLENGEGHNPAGTVTYRPGKDDGEVLDVDLTV